MRGWAGVGGQKFNPVLGLQALINDLENTFFELETGILKFES